MEPDAAVSSLEDIAARAGARGLAILGGFLAEGDPALPPGTYLAPITFEVIAPQ